MKQTIKKLCIYAMLICLLAFAGTKQAKAQSNCSVANNQPFNYSYPLSSTHPVYVHTLGQSFATKCAGAIDYIEVGTAYPNWNANLNFVLYENSGFNGNVLSNQNYNITSDGNGTFRFSFSSPIAINANAVYTYAVHNNNPTAIYFAYCDYNPYAGGVSFFNEFGNSTYPNTLYDMVFNVHVQASCTATYSTFTTAACNSFTWVEKANTVYTTNNNTDTIMLINAEGCDSIVTLDLTINQPTTSTNSLGICVSELPYSWNGLTFYDTGTQTATITNAAGCDSVATLTLSINPTITSSTDINVCEYNMPYYWNGLTFYSTSSQTATLTNADGCDSLATLNLTVIPTPNAGTVSSNTGSNSFCIGSPFVLSSDNSQGLYWYIISSNVQMVYFNTFKGTAVGNGVIKYAVYNSCGSDVGFYYLDITAPSINTTNITACGSYTWANTGRTYTQSGTYTGTTTNCVTEQLVLTINAGTGTNTTQTACNSYTWASNGSTYNSSGTYYYSYINSSGCMSRDTLNLTILSNSTNTTAITACGGYTWANNGVTYTTSGTYTGTTTNCVTQVLNLTIEKILSAGTISSSISTTCAGGTIPLSITGANAFGVWSSSDPATATVNANGIVNSITDGMVGIRYAVTNSCGTANAFYSVTFIANTTNTTSISACGSYTWANNGRTYTSSGLYTGNTSNCVTQVLNLTINQPTTSTFTVSACGSYTWAAKRNKVYVANNTTDTVKLVNSKGCDSVVRLNLTITPITTSTVSITACNSYTWPNNGVTYTQSGTYTGTTSSNCVTGKLNLTINKSTITITSIVACNSYTWAANKQTYTTSGTYINNYINTKGCPSSDTLKLVLLKNSRTNITACSSYVWNGITYATAGIYTRSYINSNGCTMVDTLSLKIFSDTFQNIKITAPTSSVCTNGKLQLAVNYTGTGGVWEVQNPIFGVISQTGLLTGLYAPSTAVVRYSITDAKGCKSPYLLYNVTVNKIPVVPAITSLSNNICSQNGTLQFSNALVGGVWSCEDTSRATVSNTGLVTGKKRGSPDITYTVNVNGCINSTTKAVNIGSIAPSTAVPSTNLCLGGGSLQLKNADAVYGNNGYWTVISGSGQVLRNIGDFTSSVLGTVVVRFNATVNGCNLFTDISINVVSNTAPKPIITTSTTKFCTKSSVLLTANQPNGIWSSQTYKAYVNKSGSTQAFASSDTAAPVTIRYEGVADANGCRAFTDFTRTFVACPKAAKSPINVPVVATSKASSTEVVNTDKKLALHIYPNPVVNSEVVFNSTVSTGTYIITDMMGKTLLSTKVMGNNTKLYVGNLAKGIYIVTLISDKEKITKQMVKQ